MKSFSNIRFVFLLSLGRSGSTWIAKTLSEEIEAVNLGENRYLWERISSARSDDSRRTILSDYLQRKDIYSGLVLDKSTNLYRHLHVIGDLGLNADYIVLKRSSRAILSSRERFAKRLLEPRRIWMRVRKYHADYGWRFFIPLLQRSHYIVRALGFGRKNILRTQVAPSTNEFEEFDLAVDRLTKSENVAIVDYDSFFESVENLKHLGISDAVIEKLASGFKQ